MVSPVIQEIKRRLKEIGFSYLRVRYGRGTACLGGWIYISRPNSMEMLSVEEEKAIHQVFKRKYRGARGNMFLIIDTVAEMCLGMRRKQPICETCGTIYQTQEDADYCRTTH